MSNAMKYFKDLEAAGFQRSQAEAQVRMVLDALEGDLVTKSDFAVFQERLESRFSQIDGKFVQLQQFIHSEITRLQQFTRSEIGQIRNDMSQLRSDVGQTQQSLRSEVGQIQQSLRSEIKETEFRLITRIGFLVVSTVSIAVATLTWLIKT